MCLRSKVQECYDGFDGIAKFVDESFADKMITTSLQVLQGIRHHGLHELTACLLNDLAIPPMSTGLPRNMHPSQISKRQVDLFSRSTNSSHCASTGLPNPSSNNRWTHLGNELGTHGHEETIENIDLMFPAR